MPASAFLLASTAVRVASLNLCTDEYLLLLGKPEQIVAVSYLSHDRLESPLWRQARRYAGNRGSIEDLLKLHPSLVLTMGGTGGRATGWLARRLHIRTLELPFAADLGGVARNMRLIAAAVGDPRAASPLVARIQALESARPRRTTDAIWVSGQGDTFAPGSLGTQWLRLAGLRQRAVPDGRVTLETLLISPPKILIRSDYRSGQMSAGARWLDHPIVRRAGTKQIVTDGRPWTCMGPLMIPEIERLRRLAG